MIGVKNALIGHRPAGLGTIGQWSQNGNPTIMKQPKQSIELPRKIRVGQDNTILDNVSESHDRIREAILPYARGIDPMVGVMMQNTDGGQQASLPYKLGVFRPPIVRQENTMPLSRLPRQNTSVVQWSSNLPDPYVRQHQIEVRPDLRIVEGVAFASARPELPHQGDSVTLHGKYEARLHQPSTTSIERVEQPHPRVVDTIEFTNHPSATAAPSMLGILGLPETHEFGLERLQPLFSVEANPNYLPYFPLTSDSSSDKVHEAASRNAIQLDVTPQRRAESLLPVHIDSLGKNGYREKLHIDYSTTPLYFSSNTQEKEGQQQQTSRRRQTHRIDSERPIVPVVEYVQERRMPVTRDRAVSRQSFTIR